MELVFYTIVVAIVCVAITPTVYRLVNEGADALINLICGDEEE